MTYCSIGGQNKAILGAAAPKVGGHSAVACTRRIRHAGVVEAQAAVSRNWLARSSSAAAPNWVAHIGGLAQDDRVLQRVEGLQDTDTTSLIIQSALTFPKCRARVPQPVPYLIESCHLLVQKIKKHSHKGRAGFVVYGQKESHLLIKLDSRHAVSNGGGVHHNVGAAMEHHAILSTPHACQHPQIASNTAVAHKQRQRTSNQHTRESRCQEACSNTPNVIQRQSSEWARRHCK